MGTNLAFTMAPARAFAPRVRHQTDDAAHSPRQNYILGALPPDDYARLLPHLHPMALPQGWTVHDAGDAEPYMYFVTSGLVARLYVMESGATAAFALTGREGIVGVAPFLGGGDTTSRVVVQCAGSAFRMRASRSRCPPGAIDALTLLLLRYTQVLMTQFGQTAVCNRHHSVEQQLTRLILASLDRLGSDELTMTQESMADVLGVRRESITQAAGQLHAAGLIDCSRGRITALDRSGLEARVCECYAVVKQEIHRLLPETGCPA